MITTAAVGATRPATPRPPDGKRNERALNYALRILRKITDAELARNHGDFRVRSLLIRYYHASGHYAQRDRVLNREEHLRTEETTNVSLNPERTLELVELCHELGLRERRDHLLNSVKFPSDKFGYKVKLLAARIHLRIATNEAPASIVKAEKLIDSIPDEPNACRAKALIELAKHHLETGDQNAALKTIEAIQSLNISAFYPNERVKVYAGLAEIYHRAGKIQERDIAIENIRKAISTEQAGYPRARMTLDLIKLAIKLAKLGDKHLLEGEANLHEPGNDECDLLAAGLSAYEFAQYYREERPDLYPALLRLAEIALRRIYAGHNKAMCVTDDLPECLSALQKVLVLQGQTESALAIIDPTDYNLDYLSVNAAIEVVNHFREKRPETVIEGGDPIWPPFLPPPPIAGSIFVPARIIRKDSDPALLQEACDKKLVVPDPQSNDIYYVPMRAEPEKSVTIHGRSMHTDGIPSFVFKGPGAPKINFTPSGLAIFFEHPDRFYGGYLQLALDLSPYRQMHAAFDEVMAGNPAFAQLASTFHVRRDVFYSPSVSFEPLGIPVLAWPGSAFFSGELDPVTLALHPALGHRNAEVRVLQRDRAFALFGIERLEGFPLSDMRVQMYKTAVPHRLNDFMHFGGEKRDKLVLEPGNRNKLIPFFAYYGMILEWNGDTPTVKVGNTPAPYQEAVSFILAGMAIRMMLAVYVIQDKLERSGSQRCGSCFDLHNVNPLSTFDYDTILLGNATEDLKRADAELIQSWLVNFARYLFELQPEAKRLENGHFGLAKMAMAVCRHTLLRLSRGNKPSLRLGIAGALLQGGFSFLKIVPPAAWNDGREYVGFAELV